METILELLTIICTPLLTVLGVAITERHTDKRQKMNIDKEKDDLIDTKINKINEKSESNIKAITEEYREEFAKVNKRLDDLSKSVDEVKASNQSTVSIIQNEISTLSERVEKHNHVIERTYSLETKVAVLETRAKVSENRLKDLESTNAK